MENLPNLVTIYPKFSNKTIYNKVTQSSKLSIFEQGGRGGRKERERERRRDNLEGEEKNGRVLKKIADS